MVHLSVLVDAVAVVERLVVVLLEVGVLLAAQDLEVELWEGQALEAELPRASPALPRQIELEWSRRNSTERRWEPWLPCLVIMAACLILLVRQTWETRQWCLTR